MRRSIVLAVFAVATAIAQKGKVPPQYPLTVTVEESRVTSRCGAVSHGDSACHPYRELKAVIDGHHFELASRIDRGIFDLPQEEILMLGDYKARVVQYARSKAVYYQQTLELQYPDGSTESFEVVGESK